jgi:hypothetical protein
MYTWGEAMGRYTVAAFLFDEIFSLLSSYGMNRGML